MDESKINQTLRNDNENNIRKCTKRLTTLEHERKFMNRIEVYSDSGNDSGVKINDDCTSEDGDQGPPLPPRPPPRPRHLSTNEIGKFVSSLLFNFLFKHIFGTNGLHHFLVRFGGFFSCCNYLRLKSNLHIN